ncbi:MAG TPA: site-2 protease family protein [bacterium]|nr:site-2 protease family protein [bacterium]
MLALGVFLAVIVIHELGHFLAARLSRVHVEEFGVGIPPKAATIARDSSGTEYTINWLPIGGFVRMLEEDETGTATPGSFAAASLPAKLFITVAGVAMNFLLAFLILWGLFFWGVHPVGVNAEFPDESVESRLVPTVRQAVESGLLKTDGISIAPITKGTSPAREVGITEGDILASVDGVAVSDPSQAVALVAGAQGSSVRLGVERAGEEIVVEVPLADGKIGAHIGYSGLVLDPGFEYRYSFWQAAGVAVRETGAQIQLTFSLLSTLVSNIIVPAVPEDRTHAVESLSGPIGIGNLFVDLVSVSVPVSVIFVMMALLSVNLGVFNILPIPALDGGRAVILVIRAALHRAFPRSADLGALVEGYIHLA